MRVAVGERVPPKLEEKRMSIDCPTYPESPLAAHDGDARARTIFRHLTRLVGAYVVLSMATLIAIAVLRDDRSAVNSAVWIRATIMALSALLTLSFTVRAGYGSSRSFLRLRIVSAVMLVTIAVIISVPGTFPLWLKLEQAACGLMLLSVVTLINDQRVRRLFTADVPMSTAPAPNPINGTGRGDGPASAAIFAVDVHKSFGDHVVLDGVTLSVEPGSVFALLGPNGAGKTTMVRILSTLLEPDHGEIRVVGHDVAREPDAVRDAIGVTGQFSAVDGLLTGRENLALMADLHHLARDDARRGIGELLERFELVDAADRMVVTYSGGMRRRLDLAMTLMGRPEVIFLDEPTAGLDPRSRRTMWDIVRSLAGDGTTVFLTTQYLEEADHLTDRVAILDGGRIVAEGTAHELKQLIPGGRIDLSFADATTRLAAAEALQLPVGDDEGLTLQIPTESNVATLRRVLREFDDADLDVVDLSIHTPDLDDVFLALTGQHDGSQNPRTEREPQA